MRPGTALRPQVHHFYLSGMLGRFLPEDNRRTRVWTADVPYGFIGDVNDRTTNLIVLLYVYIHQNL